MGRDQATPSDVSRLFLQSVLSRRILPEKLAKAVWKRCVEAVKAADETLDITFTGDRASWDKFVGDLNRDLNNLDLEFRHVLDEVTGKQLYALVNRRGDEIAQLATEYTPVEIACFKVIIEQIMLAPNSSYCCPSLVALRELSSLKSTMSKAQAEIVLSSFMARGWLLKSKKGRYTLSARALLELQPYLKETYPEECVDCTICMEIVTRGIHCYTNNCKVRLHQHCFKALSRTKDVCPSCASPWNSEEDKAKLLPIGEEAVQEGKEYAPRRRRQATQDSQDPDEEGEEDEEEERNYEDESQDATQPSQSQPKRKSKRGTKSNAAVDDSMDIDDAEDESQPTQTQAKRRSRRG